MVSAIPRVHLFALLSEGNTYAMFIRVPDTPRTYQRDDNVLTLLEAMHDAFDFAHHEDTLKSIKPDSKQAEILTVMLRNVCSCSDFI